jgi:hypothetical protein
MLGLRGAPVISGYWSEGVRAAMNTLNNLESFLRDLSVPFALHRRYSIRIFRGATCPENCPPVVDGDLYSGMDGPVTTRVGEHGHR